MLLVLSVCLPGWLHAATIAGAATTRSCGSLPGEGVVATRVAAINETCREARKVADVVGKIAEAPFNGCVELAGTTIRLIRPCVRRRYHCRTIKRIGFQGQGLRVACRRASRSLKFDLQ